MWKGRENGREATEKDREVKNKKERGSEYWEEKEGVDGKRESKEKWKRENEKEMRMEGKRKGREMKMEMEACEKEREEGNGGRRRCGKWER